MTSVFTGIECTEEHLHLLSVATSMDYDLSHLGDVGWVCDSIHNHHCSYYSFTNPLSLWASSHSMGCLYVRMFVCVHV